MKTSARLLAAWAVAGCLLAGACAGPDTSRRGASPQQPQPLRILAAASTTEVMELLVALPSDPVTTKAVSFGASSALARQIRDGAPADVFVSASPEWMDFLREAGALDGEPVLVACNRLVAVSLPGAFDDPPADARALLDRLAPSDLIALADEGVPAGTYARAALASRALLEAYGPYLVGQADVRAALHAVERGEMRAGFVYATDAAVADVEVLFAFDAADHPPIEIQAAALRGAADPAAARAFLDVLRSDAALAVLEAAGFVVSIADLMTSDLSTSRSGAFIGRETHWERGHLARDGQPGFVPS